ncbi:hypothetical protein BDQ17DRAFT_1430971 [Cyathus striatus]|nr:hypothetical protein BDQ17DRAFT_1430971 [Cyathus striatus]
MSTSGPTIQQVRVANFVLTSVAVVLTGFRLFDRARTARLWWDDAWAGLSIVFIITFMASVEVHLQDPTRNSQAVKIAAYYMCAQFFYAVAWASRISILFTMIRLAMGRLRTMIIYTAMLFGLTWAILFAQVWWVCEREPGWKDQPLPQCDLGLNVAVAQVITDVLCDSILIFIPIYLIWGVRLTRAQKIRVSAIFSTTIISTAVSLNHAYAVLRQGGLHEALAATIQDAVSLMVANFSVIIAFFFRITTEPSSIPGSREHFNNSRSIQFAKRYRSPAAGTFAINTAVMEDGNAEPSKWASGDRRGDEVSGFDIIKMHTVKLGGEEGLRASDGARDEDVQSGLYTLSSDSDIVKYKDPL